MLLKYELLGYTRLSVKLTTNSVKLKLRTTNNKCVFPFSSTPTDFNIVVVQELLTACRCSLRKSCSFRRANFWLTYLTRKKINSQPTLKRFIKIATFFGLFLVENKLTNFGGKTRRRRDSRDVQRPRPGLSASRKGLRHEIHLTFLFSSVKIRISRKSERYPTCKDSSMALELNPP